MSLDEAAAILAPVLEANEFFGAGPFKRPSANPRNVKWLPVRLLYNRSVIFLIRFWWCRGFCSLGAKFFFARNSFGAGVGDFIRNTVGSLSLLHCSSNAKKINEAIEMFDRFAHEEKSARWLFRLSFRMNFCILIYVTLRLAVDIAAFFTDDVVALFIRSELFMDPAKVPPGLYPLILAYYFLDMILNRLITSTGLCLAPCTYIAVNLLVNIKFSKLHEDMKRCFNTQATPEEICKLRLIHADLCQIILFVDDIYAPIAVFYHGGTVAGFCGETIRFIERYSKGVKASETMSFVSILLSLLFLVVVISLVTVSTATVCDSPTKSIHITNELLQRGKTANIKTGSQQVRLLLSQMRIPNVQMTAWRFYKLDRSALMTTFGASVSYVSLVLQSAKPT